MSLHEQAVSELTDKYDIDTLRDIRDHGCAKLAPYSHFTYVQTNTFFDRYEDAIVEYLTDLLGDDGIVDVFQYSGNDITTYKNNMTWAFMENVAVELILEHEQEYVA